MTNEKNRNGKILAKSEKEKKIQDEFKINVSFLTMINKEWQNHNWKHCYDFYGYGMIQGKQTHT